MRATTAAPGASDAAREAGERIAALTLDECIRLISGSRGLHAVTPWTYRWADYPTRGMARRGIPPLRFTDGPRGVNLGRSTCYPVAIARGASWHTGLEYDIGAAMAREARARGANTLGSVCINIIRHPGWGRAQESFSADQTLLAGMGSALVRGIQSEQVLAVVKHFACNSIENSRFRVNVSIDERALHEVYLPHFRACVAAGAAAFMSAYNRVNGDYCGENAPLLDEILRQRWGFEGFVMSDFVLGTRSTAKALNAGLDMEMPQTWHFSRRRIRRAIRQGRLTESVVRQAARRVLTQLLRFGVPAATRGRPEPPAIDWQAHRALALQSARESVVLLKNAGVLPLTGVKKVAVIGALARSVNLGSRGSTTVKPPFAISLWQGLQQVFSGVELHYDSGRKPARAAALARQCDAVIVAAGLRGSDEGEYMPGMGGGDRRVLELPQRQIDLIEAVADANARSSVVLFGGSAIACGDWRERIGALLMAWYPGMYGGQALAEILAGRVNPGGRLPLSFPVRTADLPDFDPAADQVTYDLWHDYRWLARQGVAPAYGFGHGLGYAPVVYGRISAKLAAEQVEVAVTLRNAGEREAVEVVQVYLAGDAPGGERVPFELKGWARVTVPADGAEHIIRLAIPRQRLAWFNPEAGDWQLDSGNYRLLAGPSVTDLPLSVEIKM